MKFSIITSVAIATLTLMGSTDAQVFPKGAPGLPATYSNCLAKVGCKNDNNHKNCLENSVSPMALKDLCEDLFVCEDEHSGDETGWRECIASAQEAYHVSTTAPTAAQGAQGEPFIGDVHPVGTNASGSRYEQKDNSHKGFMNAEE